MSLFSYCVNSIMSEGGSTCVSFTIVHVKDLKLKQMMKKKINQSKGYIMIYQNSFYVWIIKIKHIQNNNVL